MMRGNIWAVPISQGIAESITLVIQFQLQPLTPVSDVGEASGLYRTSSLPNFKGLRVLLADNDDINRAVTRKLLEKLGCFVTSVASGIECLNSFGTAATPFQVVIMDLDMPKVDVLDVAMRIRKSRSRCWPSIVALTASTEDDVRGKCLQSGMNAVIRKPVTLQAMGEELYRVLQNT